MGSTVDLDGRIRLPPEVQDALGLRPGTPVEFEVREAGQVVIRRGADVPIEERLRRVSGTATGGLTTDEVMAITRGEY